ncbi:MFS transporter [Caulobacter sp.]|uniref:MFS transporter n=1 Tax=Caulobacter sp. TaxID=78 RepID=UPI003BA9421D
MSQRPHDLPWAEYVATLQPHERPTLPGSPATPDHPLSRRVRYALTGVLVSLTGGLGAAVVSANLPSLAGDLGVSTTEAAWLPIVFVMTNACMNLLLIKFRQQYGLQLFTKLTLTVFVAVTLAHLFINGFGSMIAVRAVAGICAAGMSSLGILYMMQVFPPAHRLKGLIIGIGLASFPAPMARIFANPLVELAGWQGVYLFEAGLALLSLAAVLGLKLPPSQRLKVFDRLDFVTFALFAPGVALLCAVLGMGRIVWWTEAAWIGWALVGSILLLGAALVIEHNRDDPLINLRWMASGDIVRLVISILLVRIVLSEQTSGAVGFLQLMGLGVDQLTGLFWVILAATTAGTAASALSLNMTKLNKPIAIALALIAVGAFIDSHATVLTRPVNLYFSQALLAFAAAFFIGPALLIGFVQVLTKGAQNLVSFIVVFSLGQNIGGLAGGAIVGTLQVVREKFHSSQLTEQITLGDPNVVLRLQQLSGAYARVVGDPAARNVESQRLLGQQITQQANVLAYNDVFLMIAIVALLGAAWVTFVHFRPRILARRATARQAAEAATDTPA